ncbi:MAG: signal recognition particle-docking protein FtsY [Desulfobacteraceae bacterium]|jgi:fused signal recognition particle receptor|nr:signal recognition particle-docking protein FtsY [Desulfobacteraceae bacterium]
MLDQLFEMYNIVINLIFEINYYVYLPEIAGFLAIILFFLLLRRTIKGRKLKKAKLTQTDQALLTDIETDTEPSFDIDLATDAETTFDALIADKTDEAIKDIFEEAAGELPEIMADHDPEPIFETEEAEPVSVDKVEIEEAEEKTIAEALPEKPVEVVGFLDRLKSGLSKTRQSLSNRFDAILSGSRKIDDDVLEEIEEVLITSDIGVPTTMELMQRIGKKANKITNADEFKSELKKEMLSLVDIEHPEQTLEKPHVIMVVGVNGVGKTTTIGKLAAKYTAQNKKVLLSASDTFRAAAVEQLEIWANRANADIVKHRDKSDPAAVAYDSVEAAVARDIDVVIVDTAGRLQTKVNLMEELKKIRRSIGKRIPSAPHETLLILDATTGQNAVSQAKLFNESTDITGIVLTKLDGTAKGGIVLSICNTLNVPIRYIGIGEGIDDLQEFDPKLFVDALL